MPRRFKLTLLRTERLMLADKAATRKDNNALMLANILFELLSECNEMRIYATMHAVQTSTHLVNRQNLLLVTNSKPRGGEVIMKSVEKTGKTSQKGSFQYADILIFNIIFCNAD